MHNAIDLFCGAGGTSSGFKDAGFNIALGVDFDDSALSTFNKNFNNKGRKIDLFTSTAKDILDASGLSKDEITVLIGCPPCQGYSRLSGPDGKDDPRNTLVERFGEIVRSIRPLFVTFENVPGVETEGSYFERMIEILEECGYNVKKNIVDMREYGVPQRRRRMVVVGCNNPRVFANFELPHSEYNLHGTDGKKRFRSVKDAIKDLEDIAADGSSDIINHVSMRHGDVVKNRIKAIPKNGGSLKDASDKHQYSCHKGEDRGFMDVFGRMKWDSPSPTITTGCNNPTKGRFIHPEKDRAISLREAARFQTFPDEFVFEGGTISVARQIGNAFPPRYAFLLAKSMENALRKAQFEKSN